MGSEYIGPLPDHDTSTTDDDDDTQPLRAVRAPATAKPTTANEDFHEPAYREHVTGSLVVHPSDAPQFRPAYIPQQVRFQPQPPVQGQMTQGQPGQAYPYPYQGPPGAYPGYPAYNGYQPSNYVPYAGQAGYYYPGYTPYAYPYPWLPQKPKRDGYLFGMAISSLVGSILVLFGGLFCALVVLILTTIPSTGSLSAGQQFSAQVLFIALAVAGIIGGAFSIFHSIRSLIRKPSLEFKLPWFWTFLGLYIGVISIGVWLYSQGQEVTNTPLTIFLVALAGMLPALSILALGVRRLHFPMKAHWSTSWRRFTLAVVSGATMAIVLASIFELVLSAFVARWLGVTNIAIDDPNQQIPLNPRVIVSIFILVSVIAPLVEEAVKPLAVVIMIGRIRSAAEAFILGLSCGIGFDLIETSGYISSSYRDWVDVALQRSTAGLLHGLGAGMVALGWYYLTHPSASKHRFWLVLGCWSYAVLQHAIWNGSFVLQLLPAPIGTYLSSGTLMLGSVTLPSFILVYLVESLVMLTFFIFITRKLRTPKQLTTPPTTSKGEPQMQHLGGLQQSGAKV